MVEDLFLEYFAKYNVSEKPHMKYKSNYLENLPKEPLQLLPWAFWSHDMYIYYIIFQPDQTPNRGYKTHLIGTRPQILDIKHT